MLSVVLFLLGLVMIFFFSKYNREIIPYPWVWYFSGIALIVLSYRLSIFRDKRYQTKSQALVKPKIDEFKSGAEKISINGENCRVISNSERTKAEEIDYLAERGRVFETAINGPGPTHTNTFQTRIVAEIELKNKTHKFTSRIIEKDQFTVEFLLASKPVYLYVDRNDSSKYYFDITNWD